MIHVQLFLDTVMEMLSTPSRDTAKYVLGNQLLADMTQYVPMRKGTLRHSGHLMPNHETIVWDTKYARHQFYGGTRRDGSHWRYTTPGTGKRWDLRAKAAHMDSWKRVWTKALLKYR